MNDMQKAVVFLGDGVPVYKDKLEEMIKVPYSYAPAHLNRQRAGAVATLAIEYLKAGKLETAAEHQPDYLRLSQAERELKERSSM